MPPTAPGPAALASPEENAGLARLVHDLANALASATARLSILSNQDLPPGAVTELRAILADIARARETIRDVLQLSRPASRESFVLLDCWDSAAGPLRDAGVRLETDSPDPSPRVLAGRDEIERILSSVVKAELASAERSPAPLDIHVAVEIAEGHVALTIRSSAPALRDDERSRLLNPFFLRNPESFGEGIGFAICSRIAQTQGGSFAIEGIDGHRRYRLLLPAGGAASGARRSSPQGRTVAAGRCLVVDDDPRVLGSCELMLRHLGYDVVGAASGEEALRKLGDSPWMAIIVDLHLGKPLDGVDVVAGIGNLRPAELHRTLLATGDPTADDARRIERQFGVTVLAKPFGVDELRRVLDGLRDS